MDAKYDIIGNNYAALRKRGPMAAGAIEASADALLALEEYDAGYRLVVAA